MDLFISSSLFQPVSEKKNHFIVDKLSHLSIFAKTNKKKKKGEKKIAIKYTRKSESVYELISENASTVNETLIAKVISLRTGNAFTSNILKGRKIVIRYA